MSVSSMLRNLIQKYLRNDTSDRISKKKNIKTVTIILFLMLKKLEGKSEHANQIHERYKEKQIKLSKMKTTISELKSTLNGINGKFDITKEKASKIENLKETIQN